MFTKHVICTFDVYYAYVVTKFTLNSQLTRTNFVKF